jgi:hypothetical protein
MVLLFDMVILSFSIALGAAMSLHNRLLARHHGHVSDCVFFIPVHKRKAQYVGHFFEHLDAFLPIPLVKEAERHPLAAL